MEAVRKAGYGCAVTVGGINGAGTDVFHMRRMVYKYARKLSRRPPAR